MIDVLARLLRHTGVQVEVCRNITDIDDDMLEQAGRQHDDWRMLAARQIYRFEDDMRHLRVGHPTSEPQAHVYIDEVIALAAALVDARTAYERTGAVYQRGAAVADRAGLDRETALALLAAHDGGADDQRRRPARHPRLAAFGRGRAGLGQLVGPWASLLALGTRGHGPGDARPGIDVHGGADLAFPHHAYEAAQAEDASGVRPFARC